MICTLSTRGIAYGRSWVVLLACKSLPRAYGRERVRIAIGRSFQRPWSRGRRARGKGNCFRDMHVIQVIKNRGHDGE
jgi:hypothetical protein